MTLYDAVLAQDAEALADLAAEVRDINAQFEGGRTALHEAAARGWAIGVQVLLAAGADPSLRDGDQETALHKAALSAKYECVRLLSPLATDDERDMARALMRVHRVPFNPDEYQGREHDIPDWRRTAAKVTARLSRLFGDEHATERLERVERSEERLKRR